MRLPLLLTLVLPAAAYANDFTPAPADQVPGYSATVMPCKLVAPNEENGYVTTTVVCKNDVLSGKSLRTLAILRNTIYARYGWDGFRKPWLHDYFHAQPWFHANPKFGYHLVSDADKKNAHFIATVEQSLTTEQLYSMKNDVLQHGVANITANDKIELGLISRALGEFALDEDIDYDEKGKGTSLDKLLAVAALRQLSMRDLRLLRNTIYARRGRTFKSQILRDHFSGMSWYKADATYTDARLTKTDTRNIALIRSVENEFGGPLSDEDWLTEPVTDGA